MRCHSWFTGSDVDLCEFYALQAVMRKLKHRPEDVDICPWKVLQEDIYIPFARVMFAQNEDEYYVAVI